MKDQAEHLRNIAQTAQHEALEEMRSRLSARVISISSGKGGVGKTNFALNLAFALIEQGQRVMIMDADLGLANVEVILGKSCPFNLYHVIRGEKTLREIILEVSDSLSLISGGSGVQELANLSPYQLQYFVNSFYELDGAADVLIIDTGAGISRNVLSFVQAADEAIVVCTPEPTSITDAYGLVKTIEAHNPAVKINLLVNRVESDKEGEVVSQKLRLAIRRFLQKDIEVLGYLPDDPAVPQSVRMQKPFYLAFPKSKIARSLSRIAEKLMKQEISEGKTSGFGGFLKKVVDFFG